ncbi:MAG: diphthine synthase [Candidatus Pacearchaeota archaeon]
MLYLIGLGLNEKGISIEGLYFAKKCRKIYLESYTVDFPYSIERLRRIIGKKIIVVDREFIESNKILDEARGYNTALLIYGSPLFATTHTSLILEANRLGIKTKTIHSASILDAIADTGLHLYKFGKIASIPRHEAYSFGEIIKANLKNNAHTLVLIDIGLELGESLDKLERASAKQKINLERIIVYSRAGNRGAKILYDSIKRLKNKKIKKPFCIIIPTNLHFTEENFLEKVKRS